MSKRVTAAQFAHVLKGISTDLILAGVQAINDMDGHIPGVLGGLLNLPYVGVTRSVDASADGRITVHKEYPGGLLAEFEVELPAVIGVLSAPQPPRYVPVARIRETRKTKTIAAQEAPAVEVPAGLQIRRLLKPEPAETAEMLTGTPEEVAGKIVTILADRGLVR
jgi:electron transfer flavoprotein beta subunit